VKQEVRQNSFWVYILQSEREPEWIISTTRDMGPIMKKGDESYEKENYKLVYVRRFDEMLLALGHKMLLSFLERRSVKKIITKDNPNMEDLADLLHIEADR